MNDISQALSALAERAFYFCSKNLFTKKIFWEKRRFFLHLDFFSPMMRVELARPPFAGSLPAQLPKADKRLMSTL